MAKTIAAVSTGNAAGGIGVIRITGDSAVQTAAKVFSAADGTPLTEVEGYRAKFGRILSGGEPIDEAVALVFRAPKSYTGEDVVELSVHGGLFIVQKTLEAVYDAGAAPAEPGEFTKRAFLNGKIDLAQAEAGSSAAVSRSMRRLRSFSGRRKVIPERTLWNFLFTADFLSCRKRWRQCMTQAPRLPNRANLPKEHF